MTATLGYEPTAEDRFLFEKELDSFVPQKVFDSHTHVWHRDHAVFRGLPEIVGYVEYQALMEMLLPGRTMAALFIPGFTDQEQIASANEWTARQVSANPTYRGLFFIRPEDDPEWVREQVRRSKLHGLKCYHTLAKVKPTWEAQIPDFLPEPLVKVAHEEGWVITLHMVRSRAAADPDNRYWIRRYCETYPHMKLILAHSARGFQPAHNLEGLPELIGLENLYFDNSANCEPVAHQAILRVLGHKRLMYGSDLPVSHLRGRSVAVGDSFLWLQEDTPVWQERHTQIKPALTGLEHLRSLKWACWAEKLKDSAIEDIFWNNAATLFGI